jgi:hypothetical protein
MMLNTMLLDVPSRSMDAHLALAIQNVVKEDDEAIRALMGELLGALGSSNLRAFHASVAVVRKVYSGVSYAQVLDDTIPAIIPALTQVATLCLDQPYSHGNAQFLLDCSKALS